MNPSQVCGRLQALAPAEGVTPTTLDGVQLFRVSSPVERTSAVYHPSLCVITGGTKHAYLEGQQHEYAAGMYLCAAIPMPIEAEVKHATPDDPVTGMLISLESRTFTELLVELRSITPDPPVVDDPAAGMCVVRWGEEFCGALDRLADVLDDPIAGDVLGKGRLREVLYAALHGPAGPTLRSHMGRSAHDIGGVLMYIRDHLDEPINVDDLADRAGMSRAAFDRHFKAATTLSPLRYVKSLKLNDAATQIAGGADVGQAAARVGYISASQFSRDFKRHMGMSPRDWAKTHAGQVDPQSAGAR